MPSTLAMETAAWRRKSAVCARSRVRAARTEAKLRVTFIQTSLFVTKSCEFSFTAEGAAALPVVGPGKAALSAWRAGDAV